MKRVAGGVALLVATAMTGACGEGEDRPGQVTSESRSGGTGSAVGARTGSASASGTGAAGRGGVSAGAAGYGPVSSVDEHAAIGDDVARIRQALAAAKGGKPVDWAAVARTFDGGGASRKADGSARTLAALVGSRPDVVARVHAAIAGAGPSAGESDAVRAQRVDKGIVVLLAAKVVDELDAARRKVGLGQLDPASGAAHNVDEAWAFLTAKGNGPSVTAERRAADFERQGAVLEPIVAALRDAQKAALDGNPADLDRAATRVAQGLDYVFYLATFKYLGATDDVGRAEGASFFQGIQPKVRQAAAEAESVILAAFAGAGDAAAARAALNQPAVRAALGVDDTKRVDRV